MPLLIDGKPYEPVPSLPDFIAAYPRFKDIAEEFCNKQKQHCAAVDLLYVNQREYAVSIPSDDVVRVLGSDDATTCHIIVIRHSGSGATALSHFDGHGMEKGVNDMVTSVMQLVTESGDNGRLELHMFGGFCDDRGESEKITKQVLKIVHKHPAEVHLVTACMSDLNDVIKNGTHWPILYGVGVDVRTGEIFPATFADKGPDQALRSIYTLTGEHHIRNVYDHSTGEHHIGPLSYRAWPEAAHWLQQPDSVIRKCLSTSPEVEPPYFERHIREALRFVLQNPNPAKTVFANGKPRVYKKNEDGKWTDIRETKCVTS